MPKRKKYPKLPNGYGSIKYLGKGRRNPYAVHPPTQDFALSGSPITPKALCYTDAWIKGFTVLTAYKAGTYYPGMELELNLEDGSAENLENLAQKILADYNATRPVEQARKENEKTFKEVYEDFFKWKYSNNKKRKFSQNTIRATQSAFTHCSTLFDKSFKGLKTDDLQEVLDSCPLSHAMLEHIENLLKQLYKYALMQEIVEKNYAQFIKINKPDDDKHGEPFTDKDLKKLWEHKNDPTAEFLLIMCYSGYRITAYKTLEINLTDNYFKGGVKTKSSKERIVPIHSAILPLVKARLRREKVLLPSTPEAFRIEMQELLQKLSMPHHTPHDCRHTFSMLCETYKVNENDRKRMMGHSFGSDITNSVYGHRTVDSLRTEIEKIKTP